MALAMSRGRAWPAPDSHCAAALLLLLLLGVAVGGRGSVAAAEVEEREEAGFTDGLQQGVDLISGYYDAGDHVKFGLPMAFTVTMLSWGAIEFGDDVAAAGEWGHALEAIKWGTDYFVKAHTEPFVYWAEVPPLLLLLPLLPLSCHFEARSMDRSKGIYC